MAVEKDQILAKLDASNVQAGLHLAEAQLESARLILTETEPMVNYTTADRQKATVKVRVAFDQLDPRILPQMGVKVAFQSAEPADSAVAREILSVPREAVLKSAGQDVAWVVRDGKAERRAVSVAGSSGNETSVTAGLALGETVVLNAPATLTDGAAVTMESAR